MSRMNKEKVVSRRLLCEASAKRGTATVVLYIGSARVSRAAFGVPPKASSLPCLWQIRAADAVDMLWDQLTGLTVLSLFLLPGEKVRTLVSEANAGSCVVHSWASGSLRRRRISLCYFKTKSSLCDSNPKMMPYPIHDRAAQGYVPLRTANQGWGTLRYPSPAFPRKKIEP
jgi:hypothetical protein